MKSFFCFLIIIASALNAKPFIAHLSFDFHCSNKWETHFEYMLNIDSDVITFDIGNWHPQKKAFAQLCDFDEVIPRHHHYHHKINHEKIKLSSHYHLRFKKEINQAILTEFLKFIDAPQNVIDIMASDFQEFIESREDVNAEPKTRHYSDCM